MFISISGARGSITGFIKVSVREGYKVKREKGKKIKILFPS
jgi:hypothetical protein